MDWSLLHDRRADEPPPPLLHDRYAVESPIGRGRATVYWVTATGLVLGSPAYMAPEQARGEDVGPGADLWALGATL